MLRPVPSPDVCYNGSMPARSNPVRWLVLVALVSACGGSGSGNVSVTVSEWAVEAVPSSVTAGRVDFQVRNEGTVAHELVVVRTDLPPDLLPVVGGVVDPTDPRVMVVAATEAIGPGASSGFGAELDPGSYVLICNLPAHYQAGMRTAFTVGG